MKPLTEFNMNSRGKYRPHCRVCSINVDDKKKRLCPGQCGERKTLLEFDPRIKMCITCDGIATARACDGCHIVKTRKDFPRDIKKVPATTCTNCSDFGPPDEPDEPDEPEAAPPAAPAEPIIAAPAAPELWTMDEATQRPGEHFDDFIKRILATMAAIQKRCPCQQIEIGPEERVRICDICSRIMNKVIPDSYYDADDSDEDTRELWNRDVRIAVFAAAKTNDNVYYDYIDHQEIRKAAMIDARAAKAKPPPAAAVT